MSEFERLIGLNDPYGTRVRVNYDTADELDSDEGMIGLSIECGQCTGRSYPDAETTRKIAGALIEAADRMDDEAAS